MKKAGRILIIAFIFIFLFANSVFADNEETETKDVKEEFLEWRLTTNWHDRWSNYQVEMYNIMKKAESAEAAERTAGYTEPEREKWYSQVKSIIAEYPA